MQFILSRTVNFTKMVEEINIVIEKSKDMYSSYAENVTGLYGGGKTIKEAKQSILAAIVLLKKYNSNIPSILKEEYKFVYRYIVSK